MRINVASEVCCSARDWRTAVNVVAQLDGEASERVLCELLFAAPLEVKAHVAHLDLRTLTSHASRTVREMTEGFRAAFRDMRDASEFGLCLEDGTHEDRDGVIDQPKAGSWPDGSLRRLLDKAA